MGTWFLELLPNAAQVIIPLKYWRAYRVFLSPVEDSGFTVAEDPLSAIVDIGLAVRAPLP